MASHLQRNVFIPSRSSRGDIAESHPILANELLLNLYKREYDKSMGAPREKLKRGKFKQAPNEVHPKERKNMRAAQISWGKG